MVYVMYAFLMENKFMLNFSGMYSATPAFLSTLELMECAQ